MKKAIFITILVLLFGLSPHVFAEGFVPLAPIPGLTEGATADKVGLATFINNLYKFLIGLAAIAAIIQIIWSGLQIALNKEDVGKMMDDKGKIYNAILGLILVLSPVLVFSIINPSILNLSLNLPALDTKSGGGNTAGGNGNQQNQTPAPTGCSAPTGTYLQSISCDSDTAAQNWVVACNNGGGIGSVTDSVECGGQYSTNGTSCANPTLAKAICSHYSINKYQFVNAGAFRITATFVPITSSPNYNDFQNFRNTCARDGGTVCASHPGNNHYDKIYDTDVVECPGDFVYDSHTWLFDPNGECYEINVICRNQSVDVICVDNEIL